MVKPRENRIHMYLSEDEVTAIDDWRFANRIPTRSDAIRRLCKVGLITDAKVSPLAADLAAHTKAIEETNSALFEYFGERTEGKEPDARRLVTGVTSTLKTLMKLAYSMRELNGQTHNLRESRDTGAVMADVEEVAQTFQSLLKKIDTLTTTDDDAGTPS
ncbi:hypothetical protein ASD00_35250 [Ensifer sp. Root31]|uniref:hypothetical protein n=1 Tax=Ensifer sp. Root31 TaxID=1736512 RepID=UPI000715A087|nr:hypothetical protein [Ensifer sp. Root31]KQU81293.1 hypothetical protein ASD00_35250 [Ensifer sp. Root31]